MFNHNRITTGRIASKHIVRIALVAVVLMSAIGASGALAQPAAAVSVEEPFSDDGEEFPQDVFSDGEEIPHGLYSDGEEFPHDTFSEDEQFLGNILG